MPRIKAPPKPAVPSLTGVTISFASYTPSAHPELGSKPIAQLKIDISDCGGKYTTKPGDCTHLIASQAQFDKKIDRIKQAQKNPNTSIVNYEWLADSLGSSDPIDVEDYLLGEWASQHTNGVSGANGNDTPPPQKATAAKKSSKRSRQQDDDDDDLPPPKKSQKSVPMKPAAPVAASNTKSSVKVPVDQQVPGADRYTVYINDDGVIYDATLNKSDSGKNNNKFYRIQVLKANDVFRTWTRWGRVGEGGQNKWLEDGDQLHATSEFEDKFKEKSGVKWQDRDGPSKKGKYVYLEVNYEDSDGEGEEDTPITIQDDDEEEEKQVFAASKLSNPVQKLMELIFDVKNFDASMLELDYDAKKMPLGKLSKKTLLKGYEMLKDLASLVADPTLAGTMGENQSEALADRSNSYFSLVPHVVGRRALPVLRDMDSIRVCSLGLFLFESEKLLTVV